MIGSLGVLLVFAPLHSQSATEMGNSETRHLDQVKSSTNITKPVLLAAGELDERTADKKFYLGAHVAQAHRRQGREETIKSR